MHLAMLKDLLYTHTHTHTQIYIYIYIYIYDLFGVYRHNIESAMVTFKGVPCSKELFP